MSTCDADIWAARRLREMYDSMLLPTPPNCVHDAKCGPTPKMIAHLAVAAAALGSSERDWRRWMCQRSPLVAGRRLEEAVSCMRASGLWPWAA